MTEAAPSPYPNPVPTPPPTPHLTKQEQQERTLYNSSYLSIFFRNFLAGFARTLGGLILYFVFIFILGRIVMIYLLPQLQPLLDTFINIGNITSQAQQLPPPNQIDSNQLNQMLQKLNQ